MLTKSAFIWLVKINIVKYYYNTITTAFYFKLLFIYSYSKLNFQELLVLCHMILQKFFYTDLLLKKHFLSLSMLTTIFKDIYCI